MGVSKDERFENDMTKSGKRCPNESCKDFKEDLEKVSGEKRYTCHYCGAIFEYDEEDKANAWFEGFK